MAKWRVCVPSLFCQGLPIEELARQLLLSTPDVGVCRASLAAAACFARQHFVHFAQTELAERLREKAFRIELDRLLRDPKHVTASSLVALATRHHICPSSLSRQALKVLLVAEEPDSRQRNKLASAVLKDPSQLAAMGLEWVRAPIETCTLADHDAGPVVDLQRREFGEALEKLLESRLDAMGIPFETEASLRGKGARVTPDALLLVPAGIATGSDGVAGARTGPSTSAASSAASSAPPAAVIINWIDSKAMFGCKVSAAEHAAQCSAYVREHGRGAVVYWYGVEQGVQEAMGPNVVVLTSLPRAFALPGGVIATLRDSAEGPVPIPEFIGGEKLV